MTQAAIVKVLVDSSAGIHSELAQRWGVSVVPLTVTWAQETFLDGVDLPPADFYAKLAVSPTNPKTSAPNPAKFAAACNAAFEAGFQQVLIVTVTPNMSAAYANACLAASEFGPDQVAVLDSGTGAGAQALVAAHAARVAKAGAALPAVLAAARAACDHTQAWMAAETLRYLRRSGRISGPQATLGELIQLKPILTFIDHRLQVVAKPRTMSRAAAWLLEQISRDPQQVEQVLVSYGDSPVQALDLASRVGRLLPGVEVDISPVSYVVGGNVGPGLLGLAVLRRF